MYNLGRIILALLAAAFAVFIVASIAWCGGFNFDRRTSDTAMLGFVSWVAAGAGFWLTFSEIGPRKKS